MTGKIYHDRKNINESVYLYLICECGCEDVRAELQEDGGGEVGVVEVGGGGEGPHHHRQDLRSQGGRGPGAGLNWRQP